MISMGRLLSSRKPRPISYLLLSTPYSTFFYPHHNFFSYDVSNLKEKEEEQEGKKKKKKG